MSETEQFISLNETNDERQGSSDESSEQQNHEKVARTLFLCERKIG